MKKRFKNKIITGILSVIPENSVRFIDEIDNYGFTREKSFKLQQTMGLNKRRIVNNDICTSDLCLFGLEYIIEKGLLNKKDISALIFISQTPDHFVPPTSSILHGKLGLDNDVLCLDINQGCAGYLYGLLQAFLLLDALGEKGKIILLNGDTLSRCSCKYDRNIYPLIGDAGAITVVENSKEGNEVCIEIKTDGSRSDWLKINAGAFRCRSTMETMKIKELADGNKRSEEDFFMNGAGVFTFTQTEVPQTIKEHFKFSSTPFEQIDYFIFHQPNRFLLMKLAQKLGISKEKLPMNVVEKFGNSSSATIPINISYNIATNLMEKTLKICMAGFGVGLSWGAATMNLGPLEFCELIEF
jgi:3-oxoacyl-[acyl-carrier-protein] synthase-3